MTKISAPTAWDTITGSNETIVAVIDTGIQPTHEDLADNIWTNSGEIPGNGIDDDGNGYVDDVHGFDFFFDDSDPDDEHGHGTHVAGTIGAKGNNVLGVTGVNWQVKMVAVKIYDSTGFGTTSTMLINAYNYVRVLKEQGHNIRVTNNSYGGCDEACGYDQATKDALDALGNAGVLNVFAAGNSASDNDTTPAYPGSYDSPHVLTVASSTSSDNRSGFSNFGLTSVDLAAPGSGILSTVFNGSGYGFKSGTSMASPHVAGAAALVSSHNPGLNNVSLKATLLNSTDPLSNWDGVVRTGGRLNVSDAIDSQTECEITLDPENQLVFPEGGTFSFEVTTPENCDYEVRTDESGSFINLEPPTTRTGSTTVTFSSPGSSGFPNAGKIFVGSKEFNVTQVPSKLFPHRGFVDFSDDGMTDNVSIENVGGQMIWKVDGQFSDVTVNFGLFNDDIPIPGHWDSDMKNDFAVWRRSTGTFYVFKSTDNSVQVVRFGLDGDNPLVSQDFDGDGIYDFAVTRKQGGKLIWYILRSSDGEVSIFQFGNEGDEPLRGDYDGDGKADPAVYRPSNDNPANTFYVLKSSDNGLLVRTFGISDSDITLPNDYDGDGKTDFAVWRQTDGVWHVIRSSDNEYMALRFGLPGDLPTPGDYDGDGRTDFSVWRPGLNGAAGTHYRYSFWQGFHASTFSSDSGMLPSNLIKTK